MFADPCCNCCSPLRGPNNNVQCEVARQCRPALLLLFQTLLYLWAAPYSVKSSSIWFQALCCSFSVASLSLPSSHGGGTSFMLVFDIQLTVGARRSQSHRHHPWPFVIGPRSVPRHRLPLEGRSLSGSHQSVVFSVFESQVGEKVDCSSIVFCYPSTMCGHAFPESGVALGLMSRRVQRDQRGSIVWRSPFCLLSGNPPPLLAPCQPQRFLGAIPATTLLVVVASLPCVGPWCRTRICLLWM